MKALRYHILKYLVVVAGQLSGSPTLQGIEAHLRKQSRADILRALGGMLADNWVFLSGNEYRVTSEGDTEYHEAIETPTLNNGTEVRRWRDEALTGITASGRQSKITNAALPRDKRVGGGTIEHAMDMMYQVRKIADKMQLPAREVFEGLTLGEIRWCPKCKQWGEFGRNAASKSGWASVCKQCRRKR